MPDSDKVFAGSVPESYDRYMVPLIFQPYADDLARRVAARAPKAVLEIAAGSGAVTRAVAAVLAPDATYMVTDLKDYQAASDPMRPLDTRYMVKATHDLGGRDG